MSFSSHTLQTRGRIHLCYLHKAVIPVNAVTDTHMELMECGTGTGLASLHLTPPPPPPAGARMQKLQPRSSADAAFSSALSTPSQLVALRSLLFSSIFLSRSLIADFALLLLHRVASCNGGS